MKREKEKKAMITFLKMKMGKLNKLTQTSLITNLQKLSMENLQIMIENLLEVLINHQIKMMKTLLMMHGLKNITLKTLQDLDKESKKKGTKSKKRK